MGRFEFNSKTQRARRMLGIVVGRPLVGPQVVSLEITHHCNLRCVFCESHGSMQALPITARRTYEGERRSMDLETIEKLAADLARLGTDMVELSGKGDPIAHPQLTQIVRILKGAGLGCALVTNGTLAKPDLAPTLVERRLDRLNVSLNAGCREVYSKVNGKDLWDRAVSFLTDVLDRRKAAGGGPPWVRVSHVLCKSNMADIENMVRFCSDLRVDEVVWYIMSELPETGHLLLDDRDASEILDQIPRWSRMFEEAGVAHDLDKLARELPHRSSSGEMQENPLQRRLPCYEGWMFCVIQPDGVVLPCCYCEEEKLGNIFDSGFEAIWFGHLYREYRRRSIEMPKTGRWICSECFTTCNRATENQRIHNRVHPFRRVSVEAPRSAAPVKS